MLSSNHANRMCSVWHSWHSAICAQTFFANSKSRGPSRSSAYVALLASLSYSDAWETGTFSQSKMQGHGYPQILQSHHLLKNCAIQTEKSNKILVSATLYKPWIWSNLAQYPSLLRNFCLRGQLTVVSLPSQLLQCLSALPVT